MNIVSLVLILLVFGAVFYLADRALSGTTLQVVRFLAGAIIVVALVLFLLGLFGHRVVAF